MPKQKSFSEEKKNMHLFSEQHPPLVTPFYKGTETFVAQLSLFVITNHIFTPGFIYEHLA